MVLIPLKFHQSAGLRSQASSIRSLEDLSLVMKMASKQGLSLGNLVKAERVLDCAFKLYHT
jgi:hypothetical protein